MHAQPEDMPTDLEMQARLQVEELAQQAKGAEMPDLVQAQRKVAQLLKSECSQVLLTILSGILLAHVGRCSKGS